MLKTRTAGGLILLLVILLAACKATPETAPASTIEPGDPYQGEVLLEMNDWSSSWIEGANQSGKPRVLLVGDSITNGYYPLVSEELAGDYYPGYYTTSKFIANPDWAAEFQTLLSRYDFEIITVNNGLHGWNYPIEAYQSGLEEMARIIQELEPEAAVIWITTTPVRHEDDLQLLGVLNQDVLLRNHTAVAFAEGHGYEVLDLYEEMIGHPEYYKPDGMHFNDDGRAVQAKVIIRVIHSAR